MPSCTISAISDSNRFHLRIIRAGQWTVCSVSTRVYRTLVKHFVAIIRTCTKRSEVRSTMIIHIQCSDDGDRAWTLFDSVIHFVVSTDLSISLFNLFNAPRCLPHRPCCLHPPMVILHRQVKQTELGSCSSVISFALHLDPSEPDELQAIINQLTALESQIDQEISHNKQQHTNTLSKQSLHNNSNSNSTSNESTMPSTMNGRYFPPPLGVSSDIMYFRDPHAATDDGSAGSSTPSHVPPPSSYHGHPYYNHHYTTTTAASSVSHNLSTGMNKLD